MAAVLFHNTAKGQRSADVVVIVFKRLFAGFGNGFESGKVNDRINLFVFEDLVKTLFVADIAFIERKFLFCKLCCSSERLALAVVKVIHNHNVIAGLQKLNAGMGADKAGASGNKN